MDQIYARAACTIAATASTNSDGGLFFERPREPLLPRLLDIHFDSHAPWLRDKVEKFRLSGTYICDIEHMVTDCIEKAPLNSRAWVSQERQLSRRTMHFSDRQLFWECYKKTTCETYPNGVPRRALPFWCDDSTMLKRRLHRFQQQDETFSRSKLSLPPSPCMNDELYWAWCSFRVHYSRSALSRESDKLVALCGIAKYVSQVTGDELIAGLWKSRMIEELCWFKRLFPSEDPPTQPTTWRAPTWSWAASNNKTWISTLSKLHRKHQNRWFDTELIDINVETKLSGELTHGSLRIKCKPMLATIIPYTNMPSPNYELSGQIMLIEENIHPSNMSLGKEEVRVPSSLNMDDLDFRGPQLVYIVVIQRCLHATPLPNDDRDNIQGSDKSKILNKSQGSTLRSDEIVQSQEVTSEIKKSRDTDMLEGLLLQKNDEQRTTFSRIGMFHLKGVEAIVPILNAHSKAGSEVITLI